MVLPAGSFMVKCQRCSNVIFTTSFLQRCYNVISQRCVHVVAQRCGLRCSNVAGMLLSQRCKITTLYNVVLTLCVCWDVHLGHSERNVSQILYLDLVFISCALEQF